MTFFHVDKACFNLTKHTANRNAEDALAALDSAAAAIGFTIERSTVEALGLCPACAEAA